MAVSWEDLRKQARQLENELDLKLVSFSKLGTSYGSKDPKNTSLDTVPLLGGANSEHVFETMALEIEQLLSKLTEINDKMSEYTRMQGLSAPSATLLHTIHRHEEILKDYSREFRKTQENLKARREKEELLGSVRKDIDTYKNSSGLNRRNELYLKENEHIRNSDRLVDEQIRIAMKTKDEMRMQRTTLKAIQTHVTTLANRFPLINSLIQRVNLRKRRDSIILGAVIGVCLVFLLLYTWH